MSDWIYRTRHLFVRRGFLSHYFSICCSIGDGKIRCEAPAARIDIHRNACDICQVLMIACAPAEVDTTSFGQGYGWHAWPGLSTSVNGVHCDSCDGLPVRWSGYRDIGQPTHKGAINNFTNIQRIHQNRKSPWQTFEMDVSRLWPKTFHSLIDEVWQP